jgi:S-adenosylmethionine uptake transporter
MRGALLMTGCMLGFTINDAFMKLLLEEMPFYQALFLRGVLVSVLLVAVALSGGRPTTGMQRRDVRLVIIRSIAEIASSYFFITALMNMPLANLTAILQSLPLTVALAGALFFREPLGWRRLLAIFVGFCGVLLIVRPGVDFDIYSVYALAAVASVTVRDLAARRLSVSVSSWFVALAASLAMTAFGFVGAIFEGWLPVTTGQWGLLSAASLCLIAGYTLSVSSMRVGALAFVTPFRYTGILSALVLGFVFFGDWPDSMTLLGGAIVVSSGLVTLYREQLAARRARQHAETSN